MIDKVQRAVQWLSHHNETQVAMICKQALDAWDATRAYSVLYDGANRLNPYKRDLVNRRSLCRKKAQTGDAKAIVACALYDLAEGLRCDSDELRLVNLKASFNLTQGVRSANFVPKMKAA